MRAPLITELPYCADSAALFDCVRAAQWPVWLDSGAPYSSRGRYDIIAADPYCTLVTHAGVTEICNAGGTKLSQADPLKLLRRHLRGACLHSSKLPFAGGAIGYFGYDLARRWEQLPTLARDAEDLPEMAIGIYDWAIVVDHAERGVWLTSQNRDSSTAARWPELVAKFSGCAGALTVPFHLISRVLPNLDRDAYTARFLRIKRYIADGDCYQVNLTRRFSARAAGDPWTAYLDLRRINPAPMGAYLQFPFVQILSSSPERFLRVRERTVDTHPIKGTRPRHPDKHADQAEINALLRSEKDRAENVMIVDLLRNDLGKVCSPGSIRVPKLCQLESFATVHHLVSTVLGELKDDKDALDLLRACFPGGSITGAPKLRAMQIIEELEPQRRGVYCGAVGYIDYNGNLDLNIAIRTLIYSDGVVRFWAGGGIVADSSVQAEFQETLDKAAAMLRLLKHEAHCVVAH